MTTECTEWSMPDGDHFHGLCVNEFEPEIGSEGCPICVSPGPGSNSNCSICDFAADEYTFRMVEVIVPDRPSFIDPLFTWRIDPEVFNSINVRRVERCLWTSGPILVAVGPNFVGTVFNHYVTKNLVISSASSLRVAAYTTYGTIPDYPTPRFGTTNYQETFFLLPTNRACYPQITNVPPVSVTGTPLIAGTNLTCEPL